MMHCKTARLDFFSNTFFFHVKLAEQELSLICMAFYTFTHLAQPFTPAIPSRHLLLTNEQLH